MDAFSLANLPSGNILCFTDSEEKRQHFIQSIRKQNQERKEYIAIEKGFHQERKQDIYTPAMFLYAGETFPIHLGRGVVHLAQFGKTYNTLTAIAISKLNGLPFNVAHSTDIVFLNGNFSEKYKERFYRWYGMEHFSTYEAFCEVLEQHREGNSYLVLPLTGLASILVLGSP